MTKIQWLNIWLCLTNVSIIGLMLNICRIEKKLKIFQNIMEHIFNQEALRLSIGKDCSHVLDLTKYHTNGNKANIGTCKHCGGLEVFLKDGSINGEGTQQS